VNCTVCGLSVVKHDAFAVSYVSVAGAIYTAVMHGFCVRQEFGAATFLKLRRTCVDASFTQAGLSGFQ